MTELSDLCKSCGGKCCTNPFLTDAEYIRLVTAIGNDKAQEAEPVRIARGWMFRAHKCPGVTDTGCVLSYPDRPLVCRIYPFAPVEVIVKNMTIKTLPMLNPQTCPHWQEFGMYLEQVKKEIENNGKD